MSELAVRARNLSKRYRKQAGSLRSFIASRHREPAPEVWPLRDVSFDLKNGESLGILGRNGAGKSTVLKVLAGIYRPTSGELMVKGRVSTLLELGAGFHPELSGRENIRLNGTLLGLSRRHIEGSMERIIEFAGLQEFIDRPLKIYSSGMKLRLGYSVAMEIDPDVLIVDEIIAVGDAAFQIQCTDHMKSLRKNGTTMIIASHSMETLSDLCERTLWLDDGHPRTLGPTAEIIKMYEQEMLDRAIVSVAKQRGMTSDELLLGPDGPPPGARKPDPAE